MCHLSSPFFSPLSHTQWERNHLQDGCTVSGPWVSECRYAQRDTQLAADSSAGRGPRTRLVASCMCPQGRDLCKGDVAIIPCVHTHAVQYVQVSMFLYAVCVLWCFVCFVCVCACVIVCNSRFIGTALRWCETEPWISSTCNEFWWPTGGGEEEGKVKRRSVAEERRQLGSDWTSKEMKIIKGNNKGGAISAGQIDQSISTNDTNISTDTDQCKGVKVLSVQRSKHRARGQNRPSDHLVPHGKNKKFNLYTVFAGL